MLKKIFSSKHQYFGLEVIDWLVLILALVIFSAITLFTITKSSFWFDEAFGAYLTHYNFIDIARYTATDVHPPLFYWLLKLWSMLFGNSELALRSMSVFFGGVAIVFGYLLTKKLFNRKTAQISLIFMVLSPMLIRYSQEARMYTLVAAIAMAATYVLTMAVNTKKKTPWIVYGVLVGLGMWVHYFAAIVWIAHFIWHGDNIRRISKKGEFLKKLFTKEWRLAIYVAIGVFLLWIPLFVGQSFVVQAFGFWIPAVNPGTPLNFLTNAVYYRDLTETTGWLAFAIILISIVLSVLAVKVYKTLNTSDRQSYRLIITLAFVPSIILFILSVPLRSVFIDRYLITSTIGIAIFIGVTLALGYKSMRIKWRYISTFFMALLFIIGIVNVYQLGNYNKNTQDSNQTRQIVQAAVAKSTDGQPIIAATPWLFFEVVFYESDSHPVYFIEVSDYKYGSLDMVKYSDAHKIKNISEFAKENPIVWYVGWVGDGDLKAPYPNWEKIQEVTINDLISGKPEYKAIQYKIN